MTVTIPRARVDAVMEHHGKTWPAQGDPASSVVRDAVGVLRAEAAGIVGGRFEDASRRVLLTKLADDLAALADHYEQEATR